jgi:hypothetical protein
MKVICDDPEAEHQALDAIVAGLDERQWSLATPAEGWAIRDGGSGSWGSWGGRCPTMGD